MIIAYLDLLLQAVTVKGRSFASQSCGAPGAKSRLAENSLNPCCVGNCFAQEPGWQDTSIKWFQPGALVPVGLAPGTTNPDTKGIAPGVLLNLRSDRRPLPHALFPVLPGNRRAAAVRPAAVRRRCRAGRT